MRALLHQRVPALASNETSAGFQAGSARWQHVACSSSISSRPSRLWGMLDVSTSPNAPQRHLYNPPRSFLRPHHVDTSAHDSCYNRSPPTQASKDDCWFSRFHSVERCSYRYRRWPYCVSPVSYIHFVQHRYMLTVKPDGKARANNPRTLRLTSPETGFNQVQNRTLIKQVVRTMFQFPNRILVNTPNLPLHHLRFVSDDSDMSQVAGVLHPDIAKSQHAYTHPMHTPSTSRHHNQVALRSLPSSASALPRWRRTMKKTRLTRLTKWTGSGISLRG